MNAIGSPHQIATLVAGTDAAVTLFIARDIDTAEPYVVALMADQEVTAAQMVRQPDRCVGTYDSRAPTFNASEMLNDIQFSLEQLVAKGRW